MTKQARMLHQWEIKKQEQMTRQVIKNWVQIRLLIKNLMQVHQPGDQEPDVDQTVDQEPDADQPGDVPDDKSGVMYSDSQSDVDNTG